MNKSFNTVQFIYRYSLIFLIMVFFTVTNLIVIYTKTAKNEESVEIVNISGMQRMLVQQIARLVVEVHESEDEEFVAARLEAFESAIELFRVRHNELYFGDRAKNSKTISAIYSDDGGGLDRYLHEYIINAKAYLEQKSDNGSVDDGLAEKIISAAIIEPNTIGYLLNEVVVQHQIIHQKKVYSLEKYIKYSTVAGLLLLSSLSILIMWPAVKRLDRNDQKLRESFNEINTIKQNLLAAQKLANVGSWELDNEGSSLTLSPQMANIFEDDLCDPKNNYRKILAKVMPEDRTRIQLAIKKSLRVVGTFEEKCRLKMEDGRIKYIDAHLNSLFDEDSQSIKVFGVAQDISEFVLVQQEMESNLKMTIEALSNTLEIRDNYTAGHSHNVAKIAEEIACDIGLSQKRIDGLILAALVHDIGKIQVPMEILEKTGKLTPEEYDIIKVHPQAGYNILKKLKFKQPIASIVHQHHERIDGTGYPMGLKGDEILLEARILSAADTLEAMACDRPYRKALGMERALEVIKKGSGSIYDEQVAASCITLYENREFIIAA